VQALQRIGLRSMQDFVAREAAGKVTGQGLATTWPPGVSVRPFDAPAGYLGAVAAPGDDWSVELRPAELRDPPASASATAIGPWDITSASSRAFRSGRCPSRRPPLRSLPAGPQTW
jgi:hypothetical protein